VDLMHIIRKMDCQLHFYTSIRCVSAELVGREYDKGGAIPKNQKSVTQHGRLAPMYIALVSEERQRLACCI
jgi:hypothetical protein